MTSNEPRKRFKQENLLERMKDQQSKGHFDNPHVSIEGYGTFFINPKEIENLLKQAKFYKNQADRTRSVDCIKLQLTSVLLYLKAHVMDKKEFERYISTSNYIIAHINHVIMLCNKFNINKLIYDLKYAKFILKNDLNMKIIERHKNEENKMSEDIANNYLKMVEYFNEISNKGYSIISIDQLEQELNILFKDKI
ncbi:hypothetical protein NUSPORA_01818 [Nucleospora cyclopteri]